MFANIVTLFNYEEKNDKYYPTLLMNVELQPNYKTTFDADSTNDMDISLLIIKYFIAFGNRWSYGNEKTFKTPKEWEILTDKELHFTLKTGRDFFIKGDFSTVTDVNYEMFKTQNDGVFFIHGVKDFEDDLKHWEVTGY